MADIATRLRTFLLADTTVTGVVGQRVHQAKVPEGQDAPFIWFGRSGTTEIDILDQQPGAEPFSTTFDLEVISDDLSEAQDLAIYVKSTLNNYSGAFADSTVKGIFATDHNDQYIPRGIGSDDGRFVPAIQVEIIP